MFPKMATVFSISMDHIASQSLQFSSDYKS